MGERVSAECRRQGAWGLLGEGTGAKLLCDDTRTVLGKEHIFGELQTRKTLLKLGETLPSTSENMYCKTKYIY